MSASAARGATARIDLYDPTPSHTVGLAYLTKRYRGLAAEEFATLCQSTMQDLQATVEPPRTITPKACRRPKGRVTFAAIGSGTPRLPQSRARP